MGVRYKEAKEKILRDHDMQDEPIVGEEELIELFNDAITEAEGVIHKLGVEDDYFFKRDTLIMEEGESEITLPTDLYQNKIRGLVYRENSTKKYEIKFYKKRKKLLNIIEDEDASDTHECYRAYLTNPDAATSFLLNIVPAAKVSAEEYLHIAYIRQCNRVKQDSSIIDVPHMQFVYAHVGVRLKRKEKILSEADILDLKNERMNMVNFLTNQLVNDDDQVEMDTSIYEEMS